MTPPVLTSEPTDYTAGETVRWTRAYGDFPPSDGWTLRYYFRGVSALDVAATNEGAQWAAAITVKAGGVLRAGNYLWTAYAERGAGDEIERWPVAKGDLLVQAAVHSAVAGQLQTHAERMLAKVELQLEQLAANPLESMTAEQRTTQKRNMEELERIRARYAGEVFRERNPGVMGRSLELRFG